MFSRKQIDRFSAWFKVNRWGLGTLIVMLGMLYAMLTVVPEYLQKKSASKLPTASQRIQELNERATRLPVPPVAYGVQVINLGTIPEMPGGDHALVCVIQELGKGCQPVQAQETFTISGVMGDVHYQVTVKNYAGSAHWSLDLNRKQIVGNGEQAMSWSAEQRLDPGKGAEVRLERIGLRFTIARGMSKPS